MKKLVVRASAFSALAVPAILLGVGTAAAAPSVSIAVNSDQTITVTPAADEKGLRECEFKVENADGKKVAKKEFDYRKGDPIEPVTFGPFDPGTYTVESECKDLDKNKFKDKREVTISEDTGEPGTGEPGTGEPGTGGGTGSSDFDLLGFLAGLSQS